MNHTYYFSGKNSLAAMAFAASVGAAVGCSVAPPAALTEARNSYRQAEQSADITGNAGVALREAQESLTDAERVWEQKRDEEEVQHLAYLTKQKVEIARAIAERNLAERDIERLAGERQKAIIEAREREVLRTRKEAEARAQEAERARQQAAAAQIQAEKAEQQAAAQARDAEQARKSAAQTEAESKELERKLQALQAKVKETDRGLVLTLGDVLFEFDRAELQPGAVRNLQPLVSFLKENSSRAVVIEGHTDNIGSESYNLALSQSRADAVRTFLVKNGIAADRITARGLGEGYPVASNNIQQGQLMNRRVEIVISNEPQPQQSLK
jgi:outer membrane protein OmpA-like peptidoglycan-associated protein